LCHLVVALQSYMHVFNKQKNMAHVYG
jgi:hypothetical protein